MKKIVLLDLDNTLIDFNECARHSIMNIFDELGFTYTENVFETFITENVKIWKRLEKGEITKADLRANRWNIILSKLGIDYDGTIIEEKFENRAQVVKKMEMEKQVEYTTFSETVCRMIHEINPEAKVLWIATGVHVKDAAYAKSKGYNGISYDLNAWLNRPEVAAQAVELGVETTLWMANDYEVIDWAIRHKIDYISTDYPAKAVEYLKAVKNYN